MKIGAFQLDEPLPDLNKPYAFAMLRPWLDAGAVGSLTINLLEDTFGARSVGRLTKPGNFFDFTRYRPTIKLNSGIRNTIIPNSYVHFAARQKDRDIVFLHLLEPHMAGEYYTESLIKILRLFEVEEYFLVGGMYDTVPHTKPLLISGYSSSPELMQKLNSLDVHTSDYEGPSTITILASQEAPQYGIVATTLIVHLPQYAQLEEDYAGQLRLTEVLCSVFNFEIDVKKLRNKANAQYEKLDKAMKKERQFEEMIQQLELMYESRIEKQAEKQTRLSPEIEKFLSEIDRKFRF